MDIKVTNQVNGGGITNERDDPPSRIDTMKYSDEMGNVKRSHSPLPDSPYKRSKLQEGTRTNNIDSRTVETNSKNGKSISDYKDNMPASFENNQNSDRDLNKSPNRSTPNNYKEKRLTSQKILPNLLNPSLALSPAMSSPLVKANTPSNPKHYTEIGVSFKRKGDSVKGTAKVPTKEALIYFSAAVLCYFSDIAIHISV
jgi:hypothetical protein